VKQKKLAPSTSPTPQVNLFAKKLYQIDSKLYRELVRLLLALDDKDTMKPEGERKAGGETSKLKAKVEQCAMIYRGTVW
jgi:hypothetical protein